MSVRFLAVLLPGLLLAACSSNPVYVDYAAPETVHGDWYPIPQDAPTRVEVSTAELPRAQVEVEPEQTVNVDTLLTVDRIQDSFGNVSLKVNRQPGAAWELISAALDSADIKVLDRNRDEYQFRLGLNFEKTNLFTLFKKREELKVVLIPQGTHSLVAVEGATDVVPDAEKVESILSRLQDSLESSL